jgi:hypothetical protein
MEGIVGVFFLIFVFFLSVLGFIAHEVEEILTQRDWVLKNAATLKQRFPKLAKVFDHLLTLDTKAFAFAVIEEAIVIVLAINLSIRMDWFLFLFGIFFAYTLHLLVHIIQGIIFRGYVPGLVTTCIFFPFYAYIIYLYISVPDFVGDTDPLSLLLAGLAGACFLLVNLLFSHWLGKKISSLFK